MANPFATWTTSVRYTVRKAWTLTRANLANIGIDYTVTAVEAIMDMDEAEGLKGSWDDPTVFRASATAYMAVWLDDTDPTNIIERRKSATSRAACLPGSITDGVATGIGGFVG